ncbi:hypothetical protein DM860_000092 [Cuscuta australis]|uniref:HTH myb-type domain-containing protein n=1 Tax=Cuscuta australis TaxID=267555 RepID=A0A328CY87_9ASTE|nr:hypothetical protein DM860_000092 [Cuscuta australis]
MVIKKRLDYYGFNGYQVPPTPRATRSARRRSLTKRKGHDNQMCAFDLLACIAGQLLVDGESSPSSSKDNDLKNGNQDEDRAVVDTSFHQEKGFFLTDLVSQPPNCTFSRHTSSLGGRRPPGLVCSDNNDNVELCLSTKHIRRCGSLPKNRDDVKIGSCSRDDDENPTEWDPPHTSSNRTFRKLLASKCWELNLKPDDKEDLDLDVGDSFKHHGSLREYPYKKRKLYACGSVGKSGGENSYGISTTCNGPSTFSASEHLSFGPGDSHVKLKIKSFCVPELFIEIPETATVGSLKRTVMEAVTAILGDRLCVGVLFQGKKVRDDKKTLLQTGISHNNKLDALGFSLEPNPSQDPPQLLCPKERTQLSYDTPKPLHRYPPAPNIAHAGAQWGSADDVIIDQERTKMINFTGSDCDLAPPHPDVSSDKSAFADSRTLVSIPGVNLETCATVPARKLKFNEAARRRIRRPFSVTEVEALVQAVEKLGTGRWREVKLRAFDDAKHRTYVDLKVCS